MKLNEAGWLTGEYPEYAAVVFEKAFADDESESDPEPNDGALFSEPELVGTFHCCSPSRSP